MTDEKHVDDGYGSGVTRRGLEPAAGSLTGRTGRGSYNATGDAHAKEALQHAKEAVTHADESIAHAEMGAKEHGGKKSK